MKIMLITQLPPPSGGIATWSKAYLEYMNKKNGIEILCINCALEGKRAENFNTKRSLLTEIKRMWRIIKQIQRKKNEKFDVVHLNSACSSLGIIRDWICTLIIGKKHPIVFHCHCTVNDQLRNNPLSIAIFKQIAHRVTKVVVLNDISKEWVKETTGVDAVILPNFISSATVVEEKQKKTEQIEEVFFAGHLLYSKGVQEMAAIARENSNVHFTLAGVYQDDVRELFQLENVTLLGDVEHQRVMQALDNSDLFLFLSHTEGFSISLLEAMARGVPVLASDVGANKEMICDKGGLIVPAKNENEAKMRFEEMRGKSSKELEAISKWEINRVLNYYTPEMVLENLFNIYERI